MRGVALTVLLLGACTIPANLPVPSLRPVDGRAEHVAFGSYDYIVGVQPMAGAPRGVVLRVTRDGAPDLGNDEGKLAKDVAQAFCAKAGSRVDPGSYGMFSVPGSWLFQGGCL